MSPAETLAGALRAHARVARSLTHRPHHFARPVCSARSATSSGEMRGPG